MQIGVIADTHSKMRPEALEILKGSDVILHDVKILDIDPQGRYRVVIAGHSHKPRNEWIGDVLYFNPGGAGPRRFTLPITVGRLEVNEGGVSGEIIELPV